MDLIHPDTNSRRITNMTKAQEIYRNMKKRGRIYKAYGKWGINFSSLYVSIKEAGYTEDDIIRKIIHNMEDKGYIRTSHSKVNQGLKYIIEKWEN